MRCSAVLRGDPGAGLVDLHGQLASPSSLVACVGATELILLATTVLLIKLGLDRWGPGRMRGALRRRVSRRGCLGHAAEAEPQDRAARSIQKTPAWGLEMIFNLSDCRIASGPVPGAAGWRLAACRVGSGSTRNSSEDAAGECL